MSEQVARQVARRVMARTSGLNQTSVLIRMAREPEATEFTLAEAWAMARIVTWRVHE